MPPIVSALAPATASGCNGARTPMEKATSGSPTRAMTLINVRASTVRPLDLTPRHITVVKNSTTTRASAGMTFASVLTKTLAYSATTMDTAAAEAHDETQSLQPTTNPAKGPKVFVANTYCPPDLGIRTPSSASDATPNAAYTPPMTQASMYPPVVGSWRATSLGVRMIPAPMLFPTIAAMPNQIPSTWRRRPLEPGVMDMG